jgi:ribose 5-phosphate isomerase B
MRTAVSSDEEVIGVGTDHAGVALKAQVLAHLAALGRKVKNYGSDTDEPCDYPVVALRVAEAVARGEVGRGILVCGSGIGMTVAANKVKGVRAALCTSVRIAQLSRLHNDANILVLAGRDETAADPLAVVDAWLTTPFSGEERHVRRIREITDYEKDR